MQLSKLNSGKDILHPRNTFCTKGMKYFERPNVQMTLSRLSVFLAFFAEPRGNVAGECHFDSVVFIPLGNSHGRVPYRWTLFSIFYNLKPIFFRNISLL